MAADANLCRKWLCLVSMENIKQSCDLVIRLPGTLSDGKISSGCRKYKFTRRLRKEIWSNSSLCLLKRVLNDLDGPISRESKGGAKYFVTLLAKHSGYSRVRFFQKNSMVGSVVGRWGGEGEGWKENFLKWSWKTGYKNKESYRRSKSRTHQSRTVGQKD